MKHYDLSDKTGFVVVHDSQPWRVAVHVYEKDVNGIEAFQAWGVHETSEEAFVLLQGKGWLFTTKEGLKEEDYEIKPLKPQELNLVETGEAHAILLEEGSLVLIMENEDMSRSHTRPICPGVIAEAKKLVGK